MLCDKYAPNTPNGIIGNRGAVEKLIEFGIKWQDDKNAKPLLIYGPSGTGKTAAARALAYSNGFELIELGANDYRDSETLRKKLLPASRSRTLYSKHLLILLDEIDELSSKFDAGAEKAISELLKKSLQPIVLIANDFWNQKISFLRELVDRVEFKRVPADDIAALLRKIANSEKMKLDDGAIERIANSSNGDVRGAINDLEAMSGADPSLIENLAVRSRKLEIFGVLDSILLSRNFQAARQALENSDVELEMVLNWLDENLPVRYVSKPALSAAYDELAVASRFLEKAKRTNYYGYLKYVDVIASGGVALASDGNTSMIRPYSFPSRIRYLSRTKSYRTFMNDLASKLVGMLHTSRKNIISTALPLLAIMLKKGIDEKGAEEAFNFMEAKYGIEKAEAESLLEAFA